METTTSSFPSPADGLSITTTAWAPDIHAVGAVQAAHGVADVTIARCPDARHGFTAIDRDQITADIVRWFDAKR